MAKILTSPGKYVQGAGELKEAWYLRKDLWKEGSGAGDSVRP